MKTTEVVPMLCEWCGGATPAGESCRNCGSPLRTVLLCRYCGLRGETSLCVGCQEALAAMADLARGAPEIVPEASEVSVTRSGERVA